MLVLILVLLLVVLTTLFSPFDENNWQNDRKLNGPIPSGISLTLPLQGLYSSGYRLQNHLLWWVQPY